MVVQGNYKMCDMSKITGLRVKRTQNWALGESSTLRGVQGIFGR